MVASILKIIITRNTICDNLVSFPKSCHILLSMLVLNSRDRHEKYGFLKNVSREQSDNNIFLQHAAMQSIVRCY